ncbi:MAG: hypothetical protein OEZ39_03920 [Gammaproteobacteria bacterium]|nr:hypothetical protein [Gammaproteobacteria bacterium]MDH5651005.1 hypothetical protein [Gammaproteobacteria bacterium]
MQRKYILIFFLVPLFIFLVWQLRDEALRPEVKADLEYTPAYVDPKKNGYFALIGLAADQKMDPWEAGWKVKQDYDEHLRQGKTEFEFVTTRLGWLNILDVPDVNILACGYNDKIGCLAIVKKKSAYFSEVVKNNALLLHRYQQLLKYPGFQDEVGSLYGEHALSVHNVYTAMVVELWLNNRKQTALEYLAKNIQFWRKVVNGDVNLIQKMVSVSILYEDLWLFSEMLTDDKHAVIKSSAVKEILRPYDVNDYDFYPQFRREFQFVGNGIKIELLQKSLSQEENRWFPEEYFVECCLFKKNATLNSLHEIILSKIKLSQVALENFPSALQVYRNNRTEYNSKWLPDMLYNPYGKIILDIPQPDLIKYIIRSHKPELARRLIQLKLEILTSGMKTAEIQGYLNTIQKNLYNPYTLKLAQYNKADGSLFFDIPFEENGREAVMLN